MSLFPAYTNETDDSASKTLNDDPLRGEESSSWLNNSSCTDQIWSQNIHDLSSDSSNETFTETPNSENQQTPQDVVLCNKDRPKYKESHKHVKKRKKEKRKHGKSDYKKDVENVYFEDKYRDKGNSTVKTLCSRVRPRYNVQRNVLGFMPYRESKSHNYERYYKNNIDLPEKTKKKSSIITKSSAKSMAEEKESDAASSSTIDFEELQKAKTKEFNEKLANDSSNINLWIEYIKFQDTLEYLQKHQSAKDVHRAITMKKLSIAERAVERNVESIELLRMKLSLMAELLPADEYSKQLESLVNKDSGNIILWQELIMATQTSVAMCTVPKILDSYSKCFNVIRQKARANPRLYDQRLLQMLCWCLTFLRHTGLWEQMWETVRLNLCLNLNLTREHLSFNKTIDEKKLIGLEEVILMSRLPLNQLWQRTESLRENCHWITVSRDELELTGDSRRFVLPEDVADFVHPILTQTLNFQMVVHSFLLLKVPLLPTRDYVLQELSLKEFEWGAETGELLLPFAYPVAGEMTGNDERKELVNGVYEGGLTSGPQYIMFHPAQESYMDFLREIFSIIAENLPPMQRTSIYIWWLRFERLLIFLRKDDPARADNKGKKLKNILKDFLKKEENRNNLHFYIEYALIEKEMGRFDNAVNILETAIQSQYPCPATISNPNEKRALFSSYRTFIEILLNTDTYQESHKIRIVNIFKQMVAGTDENRLQLVQEYLENQVKDLMLEETPKDDETYMYFLPSLKCDTIVCYAYLLYIEDFDINRVISIFTDCINYYKNCRYVQELLYESQIAILQLHCKRTQDLSVLEKPLNRMLDLYPNNFFALSTLACIESNLPIWKFNSQKTNLTLWRAFAMCLANRKRIRFLQNRNDTVSMHAAINKLLHFHEALAKEPTIKCCPLLWRLYMLLLREYNLCEKKGEEIYHKSVAQCPWARGIYIDAAEIAPQVLTQVQDVIREKDLRMHVTPEELDILRG